MGLGKLNQVTTITYKIALMENLDFTQYGDAQCENSIETNRSEMATMNKQEHQEDTFDPNPPFDATQTTQENWQNEFQPSMMDQVILAVVILAWEVLQRQVPLGLRKMTLRDLQILTEVGILIIAVVDKGMDIPYNSEDKKLSSISSGRYPCIIQSTHLL